MSKELIYPKDHVEKFGAKMGYLQYIKEELPIVPQMPFVIKTQNDSIENILKKANEENIGWPRLFRSSAIEELFGYEGSFPTYNIEEQNAISRIVKGTETLEGYNNYLKTRLEEVENSPVLFKIISEDGLELSKQIKVGITEKYKGDFHGIAIEHPNQKDTLLLSIRDAGGNRVGRYGLFQYKDNHIRRVNYFTTDFFDNKFGEENIKINSLIKKSLKNIVQNYFQIKSLPKIDKEWSYQMEFGMDLRKNMFGKECIFQYKPFLKKNYSSFSIDNEKTNQDKQIIFGVTSKEGIIVNKIGGIVDTFDNNEESPFCIQLDMHASTASRRLRTNRKNNIDLLVFYDAYGIFAHDDVGLTRKSKITIYNYHNELFKTNKNFKPFRLFSDGYNFRTEPI